MYCLNCGLCTELICRGLFRNDSHPICDLLLPVSSVLETLNRVLSSETDMGVDSVNLGRQIPVSLGSKTTESRPHEGRMAVFISSDVRIAQQK